MITRQNQNFFELMASYYGDKLPKSLKNVTFGNLVDVYFAKSCVFCDFWQFNWCLFCQNHNFFELMASYNNDNSPKSQFF